MAIRNSPATKPAERALILTERVRDSVDGVYRSELRRILATLIRLLHDFDLAEDAKVFLAGRTLAKLEVVAREISAAGKAAETAQVDALDEHSAERHIVEVVRKDSRQLTA
jgi:hypothetical protein